MRLVYPLLRGGRAAVAASVVHLCLPDGNWPVAAAAMAEVASTTEALSVLIPFVGNVFWILVLFPVATRVYTGVYLAAYSREHARELALLALILSLLQCGKSLSGVEHNFLLNT